MSRLSIQVPCQAQCCPSSITILGCSWSKQLHWTVWFDGATRQLQCRAAEDACRALSNLLTDIILVFCVSKSMSVYHDSIARYPTQHSRSNSAPFSEVHFQRHDMAALWIVARNNCSGTAEGQTILVLVKCTLISFWAESYIWNVFQQLESLR